MSLNPCQPSTVEVVDSSTEVVDDHERMDLLSLNFRTLELREEKCLNKIYMDVEVQDQIILQTDSKSSKNEKRRPQQFATIDNESSADRNGKTLDIISLDELAWHDRAIDCWVAIYDYVYDCTKFVKSHPGGQDVLLEYAGRDATLAFIGSGHSNEASKILEKYLIGELPLCERIFRIVDGVKIVQQ